MITDCLLELLDELPLPTRRRRRILAEVGDHLACAVAELHADGLGVEEAEREASRPFGPAAELAQGFLEQEAALAGKRVAQASAALAALLAIVVLGPRTLVFPWADGVFPAALLGFVLAQVALVAGGLTVVRAWRAPQEGGPRGLRLRFVLRGAVVVMGCAAGTVASGMADALASGAGSSWNPATWVTIGVLALGLALTGTRLSRSWRLAISAAATGERIGTKTDPQLAPAVAGSDVDALGRLQDAAVSALARLQRREPTLRSVLRRAAALAAQLSHRAPWLATWLDLRRHPWRFATTTATAAGFSLAASHAVTEGVSGAHLQDALLASGLVATVEALATLLGLAVLGRFLGIRAPLS